VSEPNRSLVVWDDRSLVEAFTECFSKLGDLTFFEDLDPVAAQLATQAQNEMGMREWRPQKCDTAPASLANLYARLPGSFPPLYERLVLSYRWAEVDLKRLRLLANPPDKDLSGLAAEIFRDKGLARILIPNGYIQFAKAPGVNHDPVCFDTRRRSADGDCPVVQVDHEAALCSSRVRVGDELASSFRHLVGLILGDAGTFGRVGL
jgi:hypothetical protein